MVEMTTTAFVAGASALAARPRGLLGSRVCSRPSSAMAARRRAPTLCLATPAKPKAADENEEILDEMAMRAAEIHEVLTGLEEFKMRIIDGAFPRLRCTVCD